VRAVRNGARVGSNIAPARALRSSISELIAPVAGRLFVEAREPVIAKTLPVSLEALLGTPSMPSGPRAA
jgi:hypothetical protein